MYSITTLWIDCRKRKKESKRKHYSYYPKYMILVSYFFSAFGIVDVAKKPVSLKLNKMGFFLILQIGNINKIYLFSHLCYLFYKNVILSFTSAEMLKNSCKVVHDPFSNLFFFFCYGLDKQDKTN